MAYRTVHVDGEEYEYTVGRTHLKVKGVGVVTKQDLAASIQDPGADYVHPDLGDEQGIAVSPGDVVRWIRSNRS